MINYHLLLSAVVNGDDDAMDAVMDRGVDPNIQNWSKKTALHMAAQTSQPQMVLRLLSNYNANVTLQDGVGATALHIVVKHSADDIDKTKELEADAEIVEKLMAKGADPKAIDDEGLTVNHMAEKISATKKIQDLLADPPLVEGLSESPPLKWEEPEPPQSQDQLNACLAFKATLVECFYDENKRKDQFVFEKTTSIFELLYGSGPEKIFDRARPPSQRKLQPRCRWIHVPANNVSVLALIQIRSN